MFSCQLALCWPFPVWGLACMGAGWVVCFGEVWAENFYWICKPLICNFTEHVSLLQVFFVHFVETDCLPGLYVDRSGGKGLIVTWGQILKCDMTRAWKISVHVSNCMLMCIIMYDCAHMYTYIWLNACTCDVYVYMSVYMCECMYACLHLCVQVYIYVCMCVYAYMYICVYICVYIVCICIYMYIDIDIYTHRIFY